MGYEMAIWSNLIVLYSKRKIIIFYTSKDSHLARSSNIELVYQAQYPLLVDTRRIERDQTILIILEESEKIAKII